MNRVVSFPRSPTVRPAPPLVMVEMLEDRIESRLAVPAETAAAVVDNCRCLLTRARSIGWPTAFTLNARRLHDANWSGVPWIDGFRPCRNDMIFEIDKSSCYSSPEFADAITQSGNSFLLAGFSGEQTCLSTLVEATNYGHHGGIVVDACHVRLLNGFDAHGSLKALLAVVGNFASTITTADWLETTQAPLGIVEATDVD